MNRRTPLLAIAVLTSLFYIIGPGTAKADNGLSRYLKVYVVEVQYEHVTSGSTFWATEFESTKFEDAMLVLDLIETAFETGNARVILGLDSHSLLVPLQAQWRIRYEYVRVEAAPTKPKVGSSVIQRR
ncbi:hypothetical protein [Stieleria varia]|uniref:Uncharacterized protein n=1 Tax=Stieleria varia TaxID=2528005 RepID=A0A5C6ARW3_9BACT|nr:hypothetical protein [Stieleria varia]TWU02440.1 hypothetical protein Pla52n_34900 [Stieleria varia]